ncbi:cob(I)yrinic acid a,c-diamide adenosyltransferase [Virgibacillus halophilus]|uniref:Corrinoid adenosyltransferase n=1 Tax=Tigheibacillus halophilus TaxID=361280 RepID=A0ABU5CAF5_9BACI|nr:cob(I)yrinic acid a,c-diamide adenosyltransferase [Virgibacillus halophilus]
MRIYTRSGDRGITSLVYGKRVPKFHPRVEAYGTCDEANAMIGLALSFLEDVDWQEKDAFLQVMYRVQTVLFHVGAELSTPIGKEVYWKLTKDHIKELEAAIDKWDAELPVLKTFVLPSGNQPSSTLQVARTIVRRAERLIAALGDELDGSLALSYMNRLSDLLFVASRYVNKQLGGEERLLRTDV